MRLKRAPNALLGLALFLGSIGHENGSDHEDPHDRRDDEPPGAKAASMRQEHGDVVRARPVAGAYGNCGKALEIERRTPRRWFAYGVAVGMSHLAQR